MDTVIPGGAALNYPDSVESSPRSRAGDPWEEPFPSAAVTKLRLMCSYGGRIVPRPTDSSLCYLGGETRIVAADRHATLADLSAQLSRSLFGGAPFALKYQLPNEDLDALISVTTDEDLENMVDEYDRLAASNTAVGGGSTRSSRLRLFLFPSPSKPESAPTSMYSLMDGSNSETWFVDALNGTMGVDGGLPRGLSSDAAASVNCLLGLEDNASVRSRGVAASAAEAEHRRFLPRPDSSGKLSRGNGQDVHSIPDSPMLDNSSSFGSASSVPSLSNLPPIRDDRPTDPQTAGLEEHLGQMNLSATPVPVIPPSIPPLPPATASIPTIISATENPKRTVPSDDRQLLQQKLAPVDAPISDPSVSRPIYNQDRSVPTTDLKREPPASDPSFQAPMPAAATDARYLLPLTQQEQPQQQQQQQQQFIHANHPHHHYAHPIPSYYQIPHSIQHSQQFNPQVPMYFLPVRANPTYNLQMQQPNRGDPAPAPPKTPANPELQASQYMTTANPGFQQAQVVHMGPEYAGMGYQLMHQQHPAQSTVTMPGYGYEYADRAHGPQVYYTQSTSPPALPPQYQTMNAAAVMNPDLATQQQQQQQQQQKQLDEVKQTRAS